MAGLEGTMRALNRRCLGRPLDAGAACSAAYDVARAAKQLLVVAVPGSSGGGNGGGE
jgi:hypothetical protein